MKLFDVRSLGEKTVVSLCDGKCLGFVCDVKFTCDEGKAVAIVVSGEGGLFCFSRGENIIIPWDKIECIGEDTVLVRVASGECKRDECGCHGKEKRRFLWF